MRYTEDTEIEIREHDDGVGLYEILRPNWQRISSILTSFTGIKDTNGHIIVRTDYYTENEIKVALRFLKTQGYKKVEQIAGLFANWEVVEKQ